MLHEKNPNLLVQYFKFKFEMRFLDLLTFHVLINKPDILTVLEITVDPTSYTILIIVLFYTCQDSIGPENGWL